MTRVMLRDLTINYKCVGSSVPLRLSVNLMKHCAVFNYCGSVTAFTALSGTKQQGNFDTASLRISILTTGKVHVLTGKLRRAAQGRIGIGTIFY